MMLSTHDDLEICDNKFACGRSSFSDHCMDALFLKIPLVSIHMAQFTFFVGFLLPFFGYISCGKPTYLVQ
jgi:hypothetical protein